MKKSLLYFYIFGLFNLWNASAQYLQVDNTYSAQQLVNKLVDNSCAQVSNISIQGSPDNKSYAFFTNNSPSFPFTDGIVLSTGYATSASGPNNSLLSEGSTAWQGDSDLEDALSVSGTINATVLEFDFIPFTDQISFDYIFASEQYLTSITSSNQCNYTDGFAFLIKEAGSIAPYQNLAVVPGTNIPVKVNTVRGPGVCPSANEQYFDNFNPQEYPINYNGQTVVLQATTAVTAGTLYHIKLVVADQGNNLYDSAIFLGGGSFKNVTDIGIDRLYDTNNPLCTGETIHLDATTTNATAYKWYKNGQLQNVTTPTFDVTSAGEYTVTVVFDILCTSTGKIRIEESTAPAPVNYTLLQCDEDNDGITLFNLDLANAFLTNNDPSLYIHYFLDPTDAANFMNAITNTLSFQNTTPGQIIYARITTPYSCYSISIVALQTSANGLIQPAPLGVCDEYGSDDGIASFDLTQLTPIILQNLPTGLQLQYFTSASDALSLQNAISDPQNFINTVYFSQTVYARIYNGSECYGIVNIKLVVYSFGNALDDEKVILCTDDTINLDAGNGYTSYEWDTDFPQYSQSIQIDKPGNYTVTVTNDHGCKASKVFTVILSGKATDASVAVDDFKGNDNTVSITPVGPGDYEFSLNDKHYQDSNIFTGLLSGLYKGYIRDKNGCGVFTTEFYVLDYPKFFTPNSDGVNDSWKIPYLTFVPEAEVIVFDRYGKIITGFKSSGSWDGTFNGKKLPATDYWFIISIQNRTIKGHFSLLR